MPKRPPERRPGVFPGRLHIRRTKPTMIGRTTAVTIVFFVDYCHQPGTRSGWRCRAAMLIGVKASSSRGLARGLREELDGRRPARIGHGPVTPFAPERPNRIAKIGAIQGMASRRPVSRRNTDRATRSRPMRSTGRYRRKEILDVGDHEKISACLVFSLLFAQPAQLPRSQGGSRSFLAHHVFLHSGWAAGIREGSSASSPPIKVLRHASVTITAVHRRRRAPPCADVVSDRHGGQEHG